MNCGTSHVRNLLQPSILRNSMFPLVTDADQRTGDQAAECERFVFTTAPNFLASAIL